VLLLLDILCLPWALHKVLQDALGTRYSSIILATKAGVKKNQHTAAGQAKNLDVAG
jgi:hypothetical protein